MESQAKEDQQSKVDQEAKKEEQQRAIIQKAIQAVKTQKSKFSKKSDKSVAVKAPLQVIKKPEPIKT